MFAPDDEHHDRIEASIVALQRERRGFITTWPCITEASYLLHVPQKFEMLRWVQAGGVQRHVFAPDDLGLMLEWMER
ncbi:MAG: hypothetical protein ACREFQ_03170, partial [Stellaceae bacterium]